jgi:hypothetical protein
LCHSERSEEPPHLLFDFAFAFVFVFAFLIVILEGESRLLLTRRKAAPCPEHLEERSEAIDLIAFARAPIFFPRFPPKNRMSSPTMT